MGWLTERPTEETNGRCGSAAERSPHRPGPARALGLRARGAAPPLDRRPSSRKRFPTREQETIMIGYFRPAWWARRSGEGPGARPPSRTAPRRRFRPAVEHLDARIVPSFTAVGPIPVGSPPQAVATADFNGDGKLDLAVASAVDRKVLVLLNNGLASFTLAGPFPVGASPPTALTVADFNGDGRPDLAVATANGNISIW